MTLEERAQQIKFHQDEAARLLAIHAEEIKQHRAAIANLCK